MEQVINKIYVVRHLCHLLGESSFSYHLSRDAAEKEYYDTKKQWLSDEDYLEILDDVDNDDYKEFYLDAEDGNLYCLQFQAVEVK